MAKRRKPWTNEEVFNTKFGRITVLDIIPAKQSQYKRCKELVCKCDCGTIFHARFDNVTSGNTSSCGCFESESIRKRVRKPIVGKRFGRLVVISEEDLHGSDSNTRTAICKCDCGNVVRKRIKDLKRGFTQSCGCLKAESIRKRCLDDITGQTFGELTAIKPIFGGNRTKWLFRCSCGREIEALPINVKRGMTKSCGHIGKSIAECEIFKFLSENGIDFSYNACPFDDFRNPNTGYKLYVDFCIVKPNGEHIFIEHQGVQHYYDDNRNNNFGYEQRKVTDKFKRDYCKRKGIKLYETLYNEDYIQHLESILKENGLLK